MDTDGPQIDQGSNPSLRAVVASGIVVGIIVAVGILLFYRSDTNSNTNSKGQSAFYTSSVANIRSCPSTNCQVVSQYTPGTLLAISYNSYNSYDALPDWVPISYTDANGQNQSGFISKTLITTEAPSSQATVQTDSNTPTPSAGTSFCNGTNYTACPAGKDFICPADGAAAYCQSPLQQDTNSGSSPSNSSESLAAIIKEWSPAVALVLCTFKYTDGTVYLQQYGSGVLEQFTQGIVGILTNRHIFTDSHSYFANNCVFDFPNFNNNPVFVDNTNIKSYGTIVDAGSLSVQNPSSSLLNNPRLFGGHLAFCNQKAQIGDPIVVLGFPGIGSQETITATEGIISGIEGDYYVTSAKIDHGNSGGAAISVNNDCDLGIPSFADTGSIESLGRILMSQAITN